MNNKKDRWSRHGLGHLFNPTDPEASDRDWTAAVWEMIIRKGCGLTNQDPPGIENVFDDSLDPKGTKFLSMTKEQVSNGIAYASLACSLSIWPLLVVFYLQTTLGFGLPGWGLLARLTGWEWFLFETFALFLAIVATVLRSKLWRIALPVTFLMFLLSNYVMGS